MSNNYTKGKRPLILVTNDDGIDSPGLHAAAEALAPMADLLIAAPEDQQSGTGRSFRAPPDAVFRRRKLEIGGVSMEGWCLDASPATTVRHGLQCLAQRRKPDMVISGVNFGENIGTNVFASGTVGAAIQSAVWGYKSLAVSLEVPPEFHYVHGEVDWTPAITVLRRAVRHFLTADWPPDVHILKIDIPDSADEATPWRVCRQSREPGWWGLVPDAHPGSAAGTTVGERGPRPGHSWEPDSDCGVLLEKRAVAITPLSVDLSSRVSPGAVAAMFGD